MYSLIHPTHRKYIKLLRDRADSGNPILITKKDWEDYVALIKSTNKKMARHQGVYRITLRALNRTKEEVETEDLQMVLDHNAINQIETFLSKAEHKRLGKTLISTYIVLILRSLYRLTRKL